MSLTLSLLSGSFSFFVDHLVSILIISLISLLVFLLKFKNGKEKYATSKSTLDTTSKAEQSEGCKNLVSRVTARKNIWKPKSVRIFFGSQTGKTKTFAHSLSERLNSKLEVVDVVDMSSYDPEDSLVKEVNSTTDALYVFLISTYIDGEFPETCSWFAKWLGEASTDFRMEKTLLSNMNFTIFGCGNALYSENFNKASKNLRFWLTSLGASGFSVGGRGPGPKPALVLGDENVDSSKHGGLEADFGVWQENLVATVTGDGIKTDTAAITTECCSKNGKKSAVAPCASESCHCASQGEEANEAEHNSDVADYETTSDEEEDVGSEGEEVDMEDLGVVMAKENQDPSEAKPRSRRRIIGKKPAKKSETPREMITPALRKALTKQGYRLIGSHSGVKLCRWTKSMLRGRGGCYKHTFYGIESHRCMETTPSLACANKCVFCWRHHTNPVGTEWRWQMDSPEDIIKGALQNHTNLIKQFKGVPGVKPERFAEGMKPQHCALSLVGEPIMYPEINRFIELLHNEEISTFLVTNAQFPDAIKTLLPVTQLYVSVDAATKDSLKKIDRPLFKDFWERFIDSLRALSVKGQRTVYRLTLVKTFNTEELENYALLVKEGNPDFIEIKGVTYCGESKASTLTMQHVPWHEEVVRFTSQLCDILGNKYELAAEHEHSNCILVANTKFKINGVWHTWIDYPRFHELSRKLRETGETFKSLDYMAPTPHWAVMGAKEQGFDPVETRFRRKQKQKDIGGC